MVAALLRVWGSGSGELRQTPAARLRSWPGRRRDAMRPALGTHTTTTVRREPRRLPGRWSLTVCPAHCSAIRTRLFIDQQSPPSLHLGDHVARATAPARICIAVGTTSHRALAPSRGHCAGAATLAMCATAVGCMCQCRCMAYCTSRRLQYRSEQRDCAWPSAALSSHGCAHPVAGGARAITRDSGEHAGTAQKGAFRSSHSKVSTRKTATWAEWMHQPHAGPVRLTPVPLTLLHTALSVVQVRAS